MSDKNKKTPREELLVTLEKIIGHNCTNGYIQNWGPNGVRDNDGKRFRYPLSVVTKDNYVHKTRVSGSFFEADEFLTGYYAFGANRLEIGRALDEVVSYLEREHNLQLNTSDDD